MVHSVQAGGAPDDGIRKLLARNPGQLHFARVTPGNGKSLYGSWYLSIVVSVELNCLSGVTQLAARSGLLWSTDPACHQPDTWVSDLIVNIY